jgi:hypothetical protein
MDVRSKDPTLFDIFKERSDDIRISRLKNMNPGCVDESKKTIQLGNILLSKD